MRSADVEAFVEAIEAHLTALRGAPHSLSPRDFALARSWCEAGIGLAVVLAAIDRLAQSGPVASLGACRAIVEAQVPADPAAGRRQDVPAATTLGGPYPEIQERLQRLRATLLERDPASVALRRIEQMSELLSVSTRPNADHLRRGLEEIDALVGQIALGWAGPERQQVWQGEARRAAERQRSSVKEEALQASVRRHVEGRAREELDLPRVALL